MYPTGTMQAKSTNFIVVCNVTYMLEIELSPTLLYLVTVVFFFPNRCDYRHMHVLF